MSYAVLAEGAKAFCPARNLGNSSIGTDVTSDQRGGGFVLRAGPRNSRGAIEAARWNATAVPDTHCA